MRFVIAVSGVDVLMPVNSPYMRIIAFHSFVHVSILEHVKSSVELCKPVDTMHQFISSRAVLADIHRVLLA